MSNPRANLKKVNAATRPYGEHARIPHVVSGMKIKDDQENYPRGGILVPTAKFEQLTRFPTYRSARRAVKRTIKYLNDSASNHGIDQLHVFSEKDFVIKAVV